MPASLLCNPVPPLPEAAQGAGEGVGVASRSSRRAVTVRILTLSVEPTMPSMTPRPKSSPFVSSFCVLRPSTEPRLVPVVVAPNGSRTRADEEPEKTAHDGLYESQVGSAENR